MSETVNRQHEGRQRALFVGTICAGSFLLFLVQPMIARMALPLLGGAPAVWNSAMLVYQALLLGGYAYAHWLSRRTTKVQIGVHIAAFLLAALMLPIGLNAGELPPDANPLVWVPWLLLGSIGPLFFVVSAQAPLMQRWYGLSGGTNPYPLYAASNLGSFAGLISYPLLVEPLASTSQQSLVWSLGYGLLALLVAVCAFTLRGAAPVEATSAIAQTTARPDTRTMFKWLALSAIPSGLMLSTTMHLTTDIVAMPLLWVLPLGLYLLSFTVAFADSQKLARIIRPLAPLILLIAACGAVMDTSKFTFVFAGVTLLNLFCVAVALHNMMYDSRPAEDHLTRFYLVMSAGGVLGGLFCALIAPAIFNWAMEHPILMFAAAFCLIRDPLFGWTAKLWAPQVRLRNTAIFLVLALGLSMLAFEAPPPLSPETWKFVGVVPILVIALVAIGNRAMFAASVLAVMLCLGGWHKLELSTQPGRLIRSYFGVYEITDLSTKVRALVHGTTMHGLQNRTPGFERDQTTYYAPKSGVGLAMGAAPRLFGDKARISVVGLGSGTLACYARPGQDWRYYEIDPAIHDIASNPGNFSFLQRCLPNALVLIGDARLVLSQQNPGARDILALDAFSSDSVPMHLLTQEAFKVYGRYLQRDGLLMVHISNRYLDLKPVVAAAARAGGWHAVSRYYDPDEAERAHFYSTSEWIALSRSEATIGTLIASSPSNSWQKFPAAGTGLQRWTDDHASILPIIRWRDNK